MKLRCERPSPVRVWAVVLPYRAQVRPYEGFLAYDDDAPAYFPGDRYRDYPFYLTRAQARRVVRRLRENKLPGARVVPVRLSWSWAVTRSREGR